MGRTDIPAGERIDDIGFGGLKLIQKPDEFCYGIDSVLLADFAAVNHGSADGRPQIWERGAELFL